MNGQSQVSGIGQGRLSRMQADSNPDRKAVRPAPSENVALDRDGGLDAVLCLLEDRKHLVGADFHLATTGRRDRRAEQASHFSQESLVSLAQSSDESRRVFDVAEQEGDEAGGERAR